MKSILAFRLVILAFLSSMTFNASSATFTLRVNDPQLLGDTFDPASKSPIVRTFGEVKVRSTTVGEYSALVIGRSGQATKYVDLSKALIVQVDDIQPLDSSSKVVIRGWINSAVGAIAIVDYERLVISDYFWAYKPAVSPDNRHVVFHRFYPPHGVSSISDCYAIYDLYGDDSRKRPLSNLKDRVQYDDRVDVGYNIFPSDAASVPNDCTQPKDEQSLGHAMVADRFVWSADSTAFAFADSYKNQLNIVVGVRTAHELFDAYSFNANEDGKLCGDSCVGFSVKIDSLNAESVLLTCRSPIGETRKMSLPRHQLKLIH